MEHAWLRTYDRAITIRLLLRSPPPPISNSLTIEHIMPQSFYPEDWPYPEGSGSEEEQESRRQTLLHSLGNLTLLTQPLNSDVSNGAFYVKRPEIVKKSLLVLNSYFQRFTDDDIWNEERIVKRGQLLADKAIRIWGYPSS